jgi:hypothetical protein
MPVDISSEPATRGEEMPWDWAARRASRKAAWRLIPFLILCWLISILDRVNIGFAALTMNKELGLTAEMFGFGAGIFFFGYFIFEVHPT